MAGPGMLIRVVCISWWLAQGAVSSKKQSRIVSSRKKSRVVSSNKKSRVVSSIKKPRKASGTPIVGMKLAETGSTWWWETLMSVPGTNIVKELIRKTSPSTPSKRTAEMIRRLDARECAPNTVCGFTINPKNSPGVDWKRVGATAGCVVAWRRTNLVKTVVSGMRKMTFGVCHHVNNVDAKTSGEMASCGKETEAFPVEVFETKLMSQALFALDLDGAVAAAKRRAKCSVDMTYEDLQRDEDGELERLFVGALGFSSPLKRHFKTITAKKTSDDIRDVMTNFKEIASYLAALGVEDACSLSAMLNETAYVAFPHCDYAAVVRAICAGHDRRVGRRMGGCPPGYR